MPAFECDGKTFPDVDSALTYAGELFETSGVVAGIVTKRGKRKPYNGHESHAAWNVSLWIGNEESWYFEAIDCKRTSRTLDSAARKLLNRLPARTPDGVKLSLRTVRLALSGLE